LTLINRLDGGLNGCGDGVRSGGVGKETRWNRIMSRHLSGSASRELDHHTRIKWAGGPAFELTDSAKKRATRSSRSLRRAGTTELYETISTPKRETFQVPTLAQGWGSLSSNSAGRKSSRSASIRRALRGRSRCFVVEDGFEFLEAAVPGKRTRREVRDVWGDRLAAGRTRPSGAWTGHPPA
jgi:hypothetical protein